MPSPFLPAVALAAAVIAVPAVAGPLDLATRIEVERAVAAADGSHRVALVRPSRVVPGDRIVVTLGYRNTGRAALDALVLANPVPAGLAYRGPAAGSPAPEVSVDGRRFAPLGQLTVAGPAGPRAATPDDVRQVRWRLDRPLGAGAQGALAFRAVVQ